MPHATKPPALPTSYSSPPLSWQNGNTNPGPNGLVRTISAEFGLTTKYSNNNLHLAAESHANLSASATSPIIGPGSGKSGRVINRLMSENDMLKRDLNIQRLSNEEAKQAARMAEAKCAAMAQDYENQLHEAEVNKSLLKRRDRQLEELRSLIDGEKSKARKAEENERTWKELLDKTENDAKRKVEQAESYTQLMEGRVSTMARHWQDQKGEVNKSIGKLGKEIKVLVNDRRHDDDQIRILAEITAQHKEEMNKALRDNAVIRKIHEDYKAEKEQSLIDIKREAKEREESQAATIEVANRLVKELKWSIGVSKNFRDASEAIDEGTR
ncbi:hypothetical protein BJ875DRAFT_376666 [Amylocarpus encephaloides]|uniref:SWI5-dependent HO expression protein 3 n=1 Tax=Amylocarpus encephaloides TaxID=45428 RepID=A0A9P7YIB5_9HELO|nr:hypothetical protein BJ875DRAFT_376666 [Amylocarpus encephaloides]